MFPRCSFLAPLGLSLPKLFISHLEIRAPHFWCHLVLTPLPASTVQRFNGPRFQKNRNVPTSASTASTQIPSFSLRWSYSSPHLGGLSTFPPMMPRRAWEY